MRRLIVHRARALACFAMPYYCIPGDDAAALCANTAEAKALGIPVRNGQTVSVTIGTGEQPFFVAAFGENKTMTTGVAMVPSGTEDVHYTIITDYAGERRLSLRLVEG